MYSPAAPMPISQAFGFTHWNAIAPTKPRTGRAAPLPGGGAEAICQASQVSQAAPPQRNSGSRTGQVSNALPRPAQTMVSIRANPTTMPSMCGMVGPIP